MRVFVLAAALAAALAGFAFAQDDEVARRAVDPASIERFLDGYVAAAMADQYPPAVMVAVATPKSSFVKVYGVRDYATGAPAIPDTLFRIASISKTFVWTSVMMLVDEGKIDLDADVNTYLKQIKIPEAFDKPVTMNDLMTHRAGFEDTFGNFFESRGGRNRIEGLKRHMPKRVAPPGLRTSYSNWGTDLAAQIVEDVSGVPYDQFVRDRILTPLGMKSTALHDLKTEARGELNDPELDARVATPHKLEAMAPVVMPQDEIEPHSAPGAVSISARDAVRWMQVFLNTGAYGTGEGADRLMSPQAFAIMRTRKFTDRLGAPDFAHGFMETSIAGQTAFGHGGTLSGFISDMMIVPELGVGVLVVANAAESPRLPDAISRAVIEQFAGANSYSAPWSGKITEEMIANAKEMDGVYLGNRRLFSKFEKIAALGSDLTIASKDDGTLVTTSGGVTKRLYPIAKDLWSDRKRDRLFAYRDASGKIIRVSTDAGTDSYEKIGFIHSSNSFMAAVGAALFFSLTAFLGLWRRQGRKVMTNDAGKLLAVGQVIVALSWFAFAGILSWAVTVLGKSQLPDLVNMGWPPDTLVYTSIAAMAAAAAASLNAVALFPVWTASGWSIWRKLHHALFALAGLYAVYELWEWRLILAPMTRT